MRILVTIPHFYSQSPGTITGGRHGSQSAAPEQRIAALTHCIRALYSLFGPRQGMLHIAERRTHAANDKLAGELHIVLLVVEPHQLVSRLPIDPALLQCHAVDADPRLLGFHCRRMLRDRWGNYDYYCYLEDDLVMHDPWFFAKLEWFNQHLGDDKLLMPNRFELGGPEYPLDKLYVDGDLAPRVTAPFQDIQQQPEVTGMVLGKPVLFRRPLNPHSGCYFLNARQMAHWMQQRSFLEEDISFVGPLESAATLDLMRTFRIYKPAPENASFLEIQHYGQAFVTVAQSLRP